MFFSSVMNVHNNDTDEQIDEYEMCEHNENNGEVLTVWKLLVRCFLNAHPTLIEANGESGIDICNFQNPSSFFRVCVITPSPQKLQ